MLKETILMEPVLGYPDETSAFIVTQMRLVLAFGWCWLNSKRVTPEPLPLQARRYPQQRETTAPPRGRLPCSCLGTGKWRPYLEGKSCKDFGNRSPKTLITDHQALCWFSGRVNNLGDLLVGSSDSRTSNCKSCNGLGCSTMFQTHFRESQRLHLYLVLWKRRPHKDTHRAWAPVDCLLPDDDVLDWIQCDGCDRWYHQACVKINRQQATDLDLYTCPTCIGNHRTPTLSNESEKAMPTAFP